MDFVADSQPIHLVAERPATPAILGDSACIHTLRTRLRKVATIERPTLISGETGTGKELVARKLHAMSSRWDRPFVTVHCGAIPDNLMESELFGHERGSFTGASRRRKGLVHHAASGTLFLDEVNSMSILAQSKLLRFLESGEYRPVGIDTLETSAAWVIAATNENLERLVEGRTFRVDLLHRLNAVSLRVPPLRARGDDILHLAEEFKRQVGGAHLDFTEAAKRAMREYEWPGNVRELRNCVESAVLLSDDNRWINCEELDLVNPSDMIAMNSRPAPRQTSGIQGLLWSLIEEHGLTMAQVIKQCETSVIEAALQAESGNRTRAAARLGVHIRTLFKKLSRIDA